MYWLFPMQSNVQPGLKLILEGQTESSPSSFNVEISVLEASANKGSAIQLTPTGSMRHSRHSSKRSAAGRQVDEVCVYVYMYVFVC